MKIKLNLWLLIFFLVIILTDTFLVYVYLNTVKTKQVRIPSVEEVINPQLKISQGEFINNRLLTVVRMNGTIDGPSYFFNKINKYILPVSFDKITDKDKKVKANVILGSGTDLIISFFESEKKQTSPQKWTERSVSEIVPLLKEGNKVTIDFYYNKPIENLKNINWCNESCQKLVVEKTAYYTQTKELVDALTNKNDINNTFVVNGVSAIVSYTQ